MTGAEKIVNAMKQVTKSGQQSTSQVISATCVSTSPLKFQLENRLVIDSNFYELSNLEDWSTLALNDRVRGFKMEGGQRYFINEKIVASRDSVEKQLTTMQAEIEDLKRRVTALGG